MSNVVELGPRLKVKRTPKQVTTERINTILGKVHNQNQEGNLKGLLFIGISRTGDHMMGMVGDNDLSAVDSLGLLELQKQTIIMGLSNDSNQQEGSTAA